MLVRIIALTVLILAFVGACLFGSAGTLDWPMAWVFLSVYFAFVVVAFLVLDPDLIRERATLRPELKLWDVAVAGVGFLFLFPLALVVAGYDVKQFGGDTTVPLALQIPALFVFTLGYSFALWAMRVNRFFTTFVSIQLDRGHHVVKSGPYGYVRHPGYAGAILAHTAVPIALGSLWALVPVCCGTLLFVVRTWLEDRTLLVELPGYRDYVEEVRWRLVPGVW